jgi:hypothetical protein
VSAAFAVRRGGRAPLTRRLLPRLAMTVLLGLSGGLALTASATARAAGGDETLAAGLRKFDEGRKAFEAGQFEEALNDFNASLQLLPSPNTRLYAARCYRALGKVASAYTELKLAAREAQDRLTASGEKRYGATRDAANDEAAQLEARVPRLVVAVPSNPPPDFVVKLDGRELPSAAWGVASETDPGTVVIEATGRRIVPFHKTVTLVEGAQERVDVLLTRVPTATMAVNLKNLPAGIAIALDGQPVSPESVATPRELDVGPHALVVSAPGYVPFRWNKPLDDDEKVSVEVMLSPDARAGHAGPSGTPKWVFFTVAGGAVAALGVATGVALNANADNNRQLALNAFDRDPSVKSSIQSQATVANILFVGGGVLGLGAVVLAFTTHWKSEGTRDSSASIAPWIGPGAGGVAARGSF